MTRLTPALAALGGAALLTASAPLAAIDHGRLGETFPIIETDMLSVIATRLRSLETSGGIAQLQARMQRAAVASVRRPSPLTGITPAERPREWLFDPSVMLEQDIVGARGERIAAQGTRVNPLALVPMPGALVFVDGRREEELAWATRRFAPGKAKIVFVAGSPFDAMKPFQRRFWFDQRGALVTRFGIRHTPAVVTATDTHLRIAEVPVPDGPERHSEVPGQAGPTKPAPTDRARQGPAS
ncbi:type-F conjugative transfer system protein TraW [Novosphingobium sp. SL115]|uniref:type-F conjugative transfer system protein TraW n=1 Tax=Novosphingobium sp. SL115 TaxID=2995150 RepID=UPI002273C5CC|nr:type-F conjugative transfer system protein TraW [Novosphingobium sp. SL115]MCY1669611.1 type-F conjugative transfer system protein TraW [Novosphingobium sp. SL115]